MVLSIKNSFNGFRQIRYINFFLDAFSNVLIVHYRKIDENPNLVTQFQEGAPILPFIKVKKNVQQKSLKYIVAGSG